MPLFTISTTALKAGAKWFAKEAGYAGTLALTSLLATHDNSVSTSDPQWRRWVVRAARTTPAGTVEDYAQFKLDLLNVTSGDIDPTWTSGDYTAAQAPIDTYLTNILSSISPSHTFVQHRAYAMQFNPVPDLAQPFLDTGPPQYTGTISKVGTSTVYLPYQVAASITLKTGLPRHWGRFYLPGVGATISTTGRFNATQCGNWATFTRTMFNSLIDAGFWPVVPMTQFEKAPLHGLMGVTQIQVDDVPDVQRRRRGKQAAVRSLA